MPKIRGERVMRCAEGHLFMAPLSSRLLAVHLGPSKLMQCPVDGIWSMCGYVDPEDLSQEELAEADRYHA
jgi:hypothetical protein